MTLQNAEEAILNKKEILSLSGHTTTHARMALTNFRIMTDGAQERLLQFDNV